MIERRKNLFVFLPLLAFSLGLALRKLGLPFGSGLILLSGIWLTFSCFLTGFKRTRTEFQGSKSIRVPVELPLGLCLFLLLFRQQYWLYGPALTWISASIFLIIILYRLLRADNYFRRVTISRSSWPIWISAYFYLILGLLIITGISMNPRVFHNFFRSSTYEEYLRRQYPTITIEEANSLIEKYRDKSEAAIVKSDSLFQMALRSESEKKIDDALKKFNRAIDLNPDYAEAYFHRGYFKLHFLELNNDLAFSAMIDFSESIRLRPGHALSYYQRGVTLAYLDKKKRVCEDMHKAYSLDSSLDVDPFIRKYCIADSTRF